MTEEVTEEVTEEETPEVTDNWVEETIPEPVAPEPVNSTPTANVKHDKPPKYLDYLNLQKAELQRAKIEGREPNFETMSGIQNIDAEHIK